MEQDLPRLFFANDFLNLALENIALEVRNRKVEAELLIEVMSSSSAPGAAQHDDQDTSTSSTIHKKAPPPPPPKKKPRLSQSNGPAKDSGLANDTQHTLANGHSKPSEPLPSNPESVLSEPPSLEDANVHTLDEGVDGARSTPVREAATQDDSQANRDWTAETESSAKPVTASATAAATEDEQAEQEEVQQLAVTRVGRPITENGKKIIVDEAKWVPHDRQTSVDQFAILIHTDGPKDCLTLVSPYLQKVFRSVVKYFPEVVIDNKTIWFTEPYAPLYFYLDEMLQYVQDDKDPSAKPEDMDALMYFYNKWVSTYHTRVRDTLAQGSAIFEHLWALFKPGDCIYQLDEFEQPRVYVTSATTFRGGSKAFADDLGNLFPILPNINASAGRFAVDTWYTEWDTATQKFTRKLETMTIQSFSGTRSITSLEFFPLQYYKDGAEGEIDNLMSTLEDRGYYWKGLISEPSSCSYHDGPARELKQGIFKTLKKEKTNLSERVLIDQDGFAMFPAAEGKAFSMMSDIMGPMGEVLSGIMSQESSVGGGEMDRLYSDLDSVHPSKAFTPLQAQLCPSTINCCVLTTMKWYSISISNLREVQWAREAFEHLVLDRSVKEMLQGLVEEHKKNKKLNRIMSDVIPSKGQGLVMVLHGPPGVGKTLTAESVAEYTQKPLFSINVGELTAEQEVVQRLKEIFLQASRWDAVLLLDEADVVLEKRSYEDIRRNGIVSVFLRMLEYYQGILFLTTNRLGTMDIAFQSRISIAIKYRDLDTDFRQQIWTNFINRLDDCESEAKAELRANISTVAAWELNGRQIRNVLTIAQSIALAQGRRKGALRFSHVEKVASETLNFQDFFDEASHASRQQLAEIGGDRRDKQFRQKALLSR